MIINVFNKKRCGLVTIYVRTSAGERLPITSIKQFSAKERMIRTEIGFFSRAANKKRGIFLIGFIGLLMP
jgi:hypothetical protein